jgi:hypothetical protein
MSMRNDVHICEDPDGAGAVVRVSRIPSSEGSHAECVKVPTTDRPELAYRRQDCRRTSSARSGRAGPHGASGGSNLRNILWHRYRLLTIARGTVPLAVFAPRGYGERTGLLGAPARAVQAFAPLLFGLLLDLMGKSVIFVSAGLCLSALGALLCLRASSNSP